jgi:hypothetical protein
VTKRYSILPALIMVVALAAPVYAQAIPEDLAKASADLAARQADAIARAQQKVAEEATRAAEAKANAITTLDLEVVISRYQGDKKISSLPYSLSVNAGGRGERTSLRMGASVPMPSQAPPTVDGKPVAGMLQVNPVNYQDIGTNIDVLARPAGEGRFDINLSVSEKSVVPDPKTPQPGGLPVIRNFTSSNNLVLRDGQTRQFTAASDRITGEVVKVEVTLRVVK